jgi:hypothetical protein
MLLVSNMIVIFKFPATRLLIIIPNHKTTIWNDLFTIFHWLVLWNHGILWLSISIYG